MGWNIDKGKLPAEDTLGIQKKFKNGNLVSGKDLSLQDLNTFISIVIWGDSYKICYP